MTYMYVAPLAEGNDDLAKSSIKGTCDKCGEDVWIDRHDYPFALLSPFVSCFDCFGEFLDWAAERLKEIWAASFN